MKYDTICFLFETPILKSYYQKYGMHYLKQLGYNVMSLDLSPIVNPLAYKTVTKDLIDYDKNNAVRCLAKEEFKETMVKLRENVFVVVTFDFGMQYYFAFKEITKNNLHYCNLSRMDTAIEITVKNNLMLKLKKYIGNISIHKISSTIISHLPKKVFHLRNSDFIILGGQKNSNLYFNINLCDENTKIEYIHSFDYEHYLEIKDDDTSIVNEKYCVFIDQYLPYHPDRSQDGFEINADRYFKELRDFFNVIESTLKIKVVISSHPRSDYESHPGAYENYMLIKGSTAELVKNCEFVFTHFSTAVSYPVLFKKPLFFITNSEIEKFPIKQKYIELYSKELGTDYINLSYASKEDEIKFLNSLEVDESAYGNYIKDYLKNDFENSNKSDSFWKRFSELIE